jgi:hypothetical protein
MTQTESIAQITAERDNFFQQLTALQTDSASKLAAQKAASDKQIVIAGEQVATQAARAATAETALEAERTAHAATRATLAATVLAHNRMAAANSTALKALDSATKLVDPVPGTATAAQTVAVK